MPAQSVSVYSRRHEQIMNYSGCHSICEVYYILLTFQPFVGFFSLHHALRLQMCLIIYLPSKLLWILPCIEFSGTGTR